MSKPPRASHFRRNRARTIMLRDGTRLQTLDDARALLIGRFGSVNLKSAALDHAIQLLLTAATTGTRADIRAATDQLEFVLRGQQLL